MRLFFVCIFSPLWTQAQNDSLYAFKGEPQRLSPIQISTYYPQSILTDSVNVIYYSNKKLDDYKLTFPELKLNRIHLLIEKDNNNYKILNVYLLPIRKYPTAKHILTKREQHIKKKLEKKILQELSSCKIFIKYESIEKKNVDALLGEHKGFRRAMIMILREPL